MSNKKRGGEKCFEIPTFGYEEYYRDRTLTPHFFRHRLLYGEASEIFLDDSDENRNFVFDKKESRSHTTETNNSIE